MDEALIQKLRELAPLDKERAIKIIEDSLSVREHTKERFDCLAHVMETVTGEPLTLHSRDARMVWRRAMIAHRMALDGFTECQIGRVLKRDHSTVNYLKHRMADAFAVLASYGDILKTYNSFEAAL